MEEQDKIMCRDYVAESRQKDGMVEVSFRMRPEQLSLLKSILYETDYGDMELLKEKIYAYGRTVRTKDTFGRSLFVFMATIIRNAAR